MELIKITINKYKVINIYIFMVEILNENNNEIKTEEINFSNLLISSILVTFSKEDQCSLM